MSIHITPQCPFCKNPLEGWTQPPERSAMTPEELEAIRERATPNRIVPSESVTEWISYADRDRPALLGELDKLRDDLREYKNACEQKQEQIDSQMVLYAEAQDELEALRRELTDCRYERDYTKSTWEVATYEIDRLRKENERLREVMGFVRDHLDHDDGLTCLLCYLSAALKDQP